jgi:glycosyltransferase involved in cell wall biosynthesis
MAPDMSALSSPTLSVVMPVFNERSTIEEILRRVLAVKIEKEIIIVDDFSTDGTREYLATLSQESSSQETPETNKREFLKILFQDRNYGKGAALRRGFREAIGQIVVIQDADLELDPEDYGKLIEPILGDAADVVYGSRFLKQTSAAAVATPNYWGNRMLTAFSNIFTGLNLTDVWTGYKTFRREILDGLRLHENRFAFEPEFTAKIARKGWRVREVAVSYSFRTLKEGKKISWTDGFRGLACTFYYGSLCLFRVRTIATLRRRPFSSSASAAMQERRALPATSKQH